MRREPLSVDIPRVFCRFIGARGIDLICAVELWLERAFVLADLGGVGCAHLFDELLEVAKSAKVVSPLPGAAASYLQMLVAVRDRRDTAPSVASDVATINVALRFFPRVYTIIDGLERICEDEFDQAVTLEIAAIAGGRTMTEWAALAALNLKQ